MASARPFSRLCCALLFALAATPGHALQLGENEAQITARHGAPSVEDHGRHLAVYFWEGWSAQLEFQDGVVGKLAYRCHTALGDAEIQALLQANGGAARWRETTAPGAKARAWTRDDGALAATDAARPTGMLFQTGAAPAGAILTDSFLLFDAPATPTALQPTTSREEPVVRSNAAPPASRSEPPPRADETLAEIFAPAAPAPPPAVEVAKPEEKAVTAVPSAAPAEPSAGQTPVSSGGFGRAIFGGIAGVGLIAVIYFAFLAKQRRSRVGTALRAVRGERSEVEGTGSPARTARSAARTSQPTVDGAEDFDSLRADQIELLLGEIFRRQGYTVELSAALGADGRSDLTLRRDGESIPVQSKDWSASRVGEQEVREFYGRHGRDRRTARRPRDHRQLSRAKPASSPAEKSIELIDRAGPRPAHRCRAPPRTKTSST